MRLLAIDNVEHRTDRVEEQRIACVSMLFSEVGRVDVHIGLLMNRWEG